MDKICKNCGSQMPAEAKFCTECGNSEFVEKAADAVREAGDSSLALGMTPHPSSPSATPPSPQGEGFAQ